MVTEESKSFERAEHLLHTMTTDVVESLIMSGYLKDTLIASERELPDVTQIRICEGIFAVTIVLVLAAVRIFTPPI